MSMAFKWAVGILFLYLVWGSVMTQNKITLCKRVSENCPRSLSCNTTTTSLILVTQAETSFQSCSSVHCDHCCSGITVVENDNFTKELQHHCNNKSTCDPTVIFKIYGFAQVSYTCNEPTSTAQSLPASTPTVKGILSSTINHAETTSMAESMSASITPLAESITTMQGTQLLTTYSADDADKFPLAAVLVPTLLALIVLVVALVIIVIRRHAQNASDERNNHDFIVSFDRAGGNIQVVNNIYGDNTAPQSGNRLSAIQRVPEGKADDEVYNTTSGSPIHHELDVYDHLSPFGANYASAFVEVENEQNYDRTQDRHFEIDPTYGITSGRNEIAVNLSVNADEFCAENRNAEYTTVKKVLKGNVL